MKNYQIYPLTSLNYSRAEANLPHADPPRPYIKDEEAACEGVVFDVEQAAMKPMR